MPALLALRVTLLPNLIDMAILLINLYTYIRYVLKSSLVFLFILIKSNSYWYKFLPTLQHSLQPVEQVVMLSLLLLLLTFILTVVRSIQGLSATQGRGLLNGEVLRVFRDVTIVAYFVDMQKIDNASLDIKITVIKEVSFRDSFPHCNREKLSQQNVIFTNLI